jgi:hypothetical protein
MKRIYQLVCPLGILLSACGGTNVGNGFQSQLFLSADAGALPAPIGLSLSSLTAFSAATLIEATVNIEAIGFVPQSECNSRPPLAAWKVFPQKQKSIDLVAPIGQAGQESDLGFEIDFDEPFTTCTLRFVTGPTLNTLRSGYSLYFRWTTAGGRSVTVRSQSRHILGLRSTSPQEWDSERANFESVLYRSSFLTGNAIPEGDGSPIVVEPESSPVLFRAFLRSLRQSLAGHRLGGDLIRDRTKSLSQGSDDEDEIVENLDSQ